MKTVILIRDLVVEEVSVGDGMFCEYHEFDGRLTRGVCLHERAPELIKPELIKKVMVPIIEVCEAIPRTQHDDLLPTFIDRKYYAYTPKIEAYLERPFRALVERAKRDQREINRCHRRITELGAAIYDFNQLKWWQRARFLFSNIEV
jgi:hypothetical protein